MALSFRRLASTSRLSPPLRCGPAAALLGALALGTGCVSSAKYDAALKDAASARSQLEQGQVEAERVHATERAEAARLRAQVDAGEGSLKDALARLEVEKSHHQTCTQVVDQAVAMASSLRTELVRQGKNVDQLLAAKGSLSSSLEQASLRLEELRRAQAAADARAALLRDVAARLKRMIDTGELQIALRSGRMVLVLQNDVLFDAGKAEVKRRGRETVEEIARVLASLQQRRFQVAGHSDNQPIRLSSFASNWELSGARSLAVVSLMVKSGMRPETLSAAGYAEFDPVQPNDTPEHRAQNRRIEITLQPNIDELVTLPEGS